MTGGLARRLRAHRSTLVLATMVVLAVAVVAVLGVRAPRTSTPLDPDNPGPAGAQALARVLADHGVQVSVARGAAALEEAAVDGSTTVLVTSTDQLGGSTTQGLLAAAADAELVLAGPGPGTTQALGVPSLPFAGRVEEPRTGDCGDQRFDALTLDVDSARAYPVPDGCFRGEQGALLVTPRPGLVLLGADQALRNDTVLRADNAAVALRLLGGHDRLVWYVPTVDDLLADDGTSLETLLPRWLRPGLWLLALVAVALVLWRGRRLGPLAVEPLPVVVRAGEATSARGRLYRRSGDRAHAAAALRAGARSRARERLRLSRHAGPDEVARAVAAHLGRPEPDVARLLGSHAPVPTTDHDLVALAGDLAELDREVQHR